MLRNLINLMPRFDAEGDPAGGGDGDTVTLLKEIKETVGKSVQTAEATAAEVKEIAEELATLKTDTDIDIKRVAQQAAQVRKDLAKSYGPSGATDFLMDTQKYLRGVFVAGKGGAIAETEEICGEKVSDLVLQSKADFITTTDATAGFLVPDVLMPGIRELLEIYGNLYPEVTKITAAAGQSLKFNKDAASPVATWRGTQLSTIGEEATPMSFSQTTIVSELLGSYIQIANELLRAPGVNFAAVSTVRMLYAILRKLETGLLAGTTGGGEPADGVIADATNQGTMATMTFANLLTFLQDCLTDNAYSSDTSRNKLFLTPTDALTLAGEQLGGSGDGMLIWGDSRKGIPTTFMGYDVIVHPAAHNGTSKHVILGDPTTISLVESAAPSVDISEHAGNAFIENASILRVFNHHTWDIGQPSEWHMKVVTA